MDTVTFLGPRVPIEVKKVYPLLGKLTNVIVPKILALVVEYIKGAEITDDQFEKFATSVQLDKQALSITFTAFYYIMRAAIRGRVKLDVFEKDLADLKLPQFFIAEASKTIKQNQALFEDILVSRSAVRYPTLEELKWRVDVTISSSSLSRVLKPTILMQTTTSDGKQKSFELSLDKFHELRYNVAKVLKDMEDLEKMPILKIK